LAKLRTQPHVRIAFEAETVMLPAGFSEKETPAEENIVFT
jgi:hypothetical protein